MREHFNNQLENLQKDIVIMGNICEEILLYFLKKIEISSGNNEINNIKENEIFEKYKMIEQLEQNIEAKCMKLLLKQQPVAKDLRIILSVLKIVYDIKRIGKQSFEIIELVENESIDLLKNFFEIKEMIELVIEMLSKILDAFVLENIELANYVIQKDDILDNNFKIIKEKLSNYFSENSNIRNQIINLLMVAKYLEKIGDHTVIVAKWVTYLITGEYKMKTEEI